MGSAHWWHACLHDPDFILLLTLAWLTLVALAVVVCAWVRTAPARAWHGEAGTATIEFTLVFPIVLFLVLLLVQTTLVMVGNIFVQYAAYAATRSAIVQIPTTDRVAGEQRNTIFISDQSPKFMAIRRAAVFAMMPVSGTANASGTSMQTNNFVQGLKAFYQNYSAHTPNWISHLAARRLRYADLHTHIQVMRTHVMGGDVTFTAIAPDHRYTFAPRDPITVRVTNDFNLTVPYVRVIFADGRLPGSAGGGAYTRIRSQCTLTNEGVNPDLPALPRLPRRP